MSEIMASVSRLNKLTKTSVRLRTARTLILFFVN
jgi:hypothetical protein